MSKWICDKCKCENSYSHDICPVCGSKIPKQELQRILDSELREAKAIVFRDRIERRRKAREITERIIKINKIVLICMCVLLLVGFGLGVYKLINDGVVILDVLDYRLENALDNLYEDVHKQISIVGSYNLKGRLDVIFDHIRQIVIPRIKYGVENIGINLEFVIIYIINTIKEIKENGIHF